MIIFIGIQLLVLFVVLVIVAYLIKDLTQDMKLIKQDLTNLNVEVFQPIAEAQMPTGGIQKRLTLMGAVKMIMDSVMAKSKEKSKIVVTNHIPK